MQSSAVNFAVSCRGDRYGLKGLNRQVCYPALPKRHGSTAQPVNIGTYSISNPVEDVRDSLDYFVESGMAESALKSLSDGFISGFGNVGGGIAGATAACYVTNVLVLRVAPPVAAAMATYCPYIGGVAGSFGGTIISKTTGKQASNLSRNFLKALTPNNNRKLIPALF